MELLVHKHTDKEVLVERGPLLIRVLDGAATEREDADFACERFTVMLERHSIIASLAIVEHGTPVPTPDVRRYTSERFGAYADRMTFAVVFLGLGFWAKTAHAATTPMVRWFSRGNLLMDTTLPGICHQLARELVGLDPEQLERVCEQLRARDLPGDRL